VQQHDRLDGKFDQGNFQYGTNSFNGDLDTFFYRSGFKFYGQFVNGKRHGPGQLYSTNGDSFNGDFKDGKRDGRGVLTLADDEKVEGVWRDDVLLSDTSAYDKARREYEKAVRAMEAAKKANTECQVIRSSGGVYQSTTARLSTSGVVDIPYEIKSYSESEARRTFVSFPLEACDDNPDTWLPVWGKFTQVKATRDDPKVWFGLLSSGNRIPLPYTYLQRFVSPQLLETCIEKAPSPVDITEAVLADAPTPATAPINAPTVATTKAATKDMTAAEERELEALFAQCYILGKHKSTDGQSVTVKVKDMHKRLQEVGGENYKFNAEKRGSKLAIWVRKAFEGQEGFRESYSNGVPVFWGLRPV